jgi:tRNA-2-methylthio-N6-dimethylallyladenosine synthase
LPQIRNVTEEELAVQRAIMDALAERNAALPEAPLAWVDTYGCQQNEADSETIRGMLREMGYGFTASETEADLIVVNTCAVRGHAELRALGNVGALSHTKRAKPGQRIALCGCMVQQEHMREKIKKSFPYVDLVFGTHELWRFPELLQRMLEPHRGRIFEARQIDGERVEGLPVLRTGSVRAWLPIMSGCNNFCSYCIVPYVRGRERSRSPEAILAEARQLIESGYKEIYLLGQNVNSYGKDLEGGEDFPWLLREIDRMDGEFVIRFMTSHPKDATERLFDTMAACGKVERHIHLPFQSGNDRVLKAMNRGYTGEIYRKKAAYARSLMPDIAITSDVIVGFPGETDGEFEDTLRLVEELRFDMLFTFLYSPRVGTPAAAMADPFTKEQKQARFDRLLEAQNAVSAEMQAAHVGKTYRILIDGEGDRPGRLTARSSHNRLIHLEGDKALIGSFRNARITDSTTWSLSAVLTDNGTSDKEEL